MSNIRLKEWTAIRPIVCVLILACGILRSNASAGNLIWADSATTEHYADLIWGRNQYGMRGWEWITVERDLEDRRSIFRLRRGGYSTPPFGETKIWSQRNFDSMLVVVRDEIGFESFMEPTIAGLDVDEVWAYFFELRGSDTIGAQVLPLMKAIFPPRPLSPWKTLPMELSDISTILLGPNNEQLLTATGSYSSVGNRGGSTFTREAIFQWDDDRNRFIPILSLPRYDESFGDEGRTVSGADIRVVKLGPDSIAGLALQCVDSAWHGDSVTLTSDPGSILFELVDGSLIPTKLQLASGKVVPIRRELPIRLLPDKQAASGQEITGVATVTTEGRPDPLRSRIPDQEHGVQVQLMLESGSMIVSTRLPRWQYEESSTVRTPALVHLALWLDSDLLGDFRDSDCSTDDVLYFFSPDELDTTLCVRKYSVTERHGERSLVLQVQHITRLDLDRDSYEIRATIPGEDVGLHATSAHPAMCGLGLEVFRSDSLLVDPWVHAESSYPVELFRFDPRTWGTLLVADRRDSVFSR